MPVDIEYGSWGLILDAARTGSIACSSCQYRSAFSAVTITWELCNAVASMMGMEITMTLNKSPEPPTKMGNFPPLLISQEKYIPAHDRQLPWVTKVW